ASGYKSPTDYASESWLISPAIDLSKVTTATLMFDHALNYVSTMANKQNYISVWVSTDYQSGLPNTATWTQVTIPTYPPGTNWTFISSGAADLSSVARKSGVRIAFKYVSIAGDAATWEVKNVVVY
ncbi:MAG TPA: choice-of-anchor J domain-containing protein, partial [Paludibacter sp.]